MIKSWLITTRAPFYGTEQYYAAYSKEDPTDWLNDNFFEEECQNLWDMYHYKLVDSWDCEWEEELSDSDRKEFYDDDYDNFIEQKYNEWSEECNMTVEECSEEELQEYVPGGVGELEIIYDER